MKKIVMILIGLVLFFMPISVYAEAQLDYITDEAGILTEEEWQDLETKAEKIAKKYDCGVYVITLGDFTEYTDAYDAYDAAVELYKEYTLGVGEEESGLLLMLSMSERDYGLIAYGYGNTAFTDYGKDYLSEEFLDDFADDNWYEGFSDYLKISEEMLEYAKDGNPVDVSNDPRVVNNPLALLLGIAVTLILSLIIAGVVLYALLSQLKSVQIQTRASNYVVGGINLTVKQDYFITTTTSSVYSPQEKKSGGTSVDSGGFSGKSGKF